MRSEGTIAVTNGKHIPGAIQNGTKTSVRFGVLRASCGAQVPERSRYLGCEVGTGSSSEKTEEGLGNCGLKGIEDVRKEAFAALCEADGDIAF